MKWSLLELKRYHNEPLKIEETLEVEESLKKRHKDIIKVAPVAVKGLLLANPNDYILQIQLKTVLTLPSTRSLKPVDLPLDVSISETYMTREQYQKQLDLTGMEDDEVIILEKDIINLTEAVEDHLLLAIPVQVLSEEEKNAQDLPQGEHWEIIREDDFHERKAQRQENKIDPRLAKLSALLDNDKE